MKRKIAAIFLIAAMVLNISACDRKKELTKYQAQFLELFDTVTTIIGYAEKEETFSEFAQSVYDDLKEYHELYDKYNDYEGINNIKTINDNAGIRPVKVDRKILDMLLYAKEAYEFTGGKMNIALGAVLEVWHDYRSAGTEDPEHAELPPMELLREKAQHTDIDRMIIDEGESTVYLEDSEMRLDVGGVAKGYATEQVVQQAMQKGYTNGLLSVGGNVRAFGSKGLGIREENNTKDGGRRAEPWSVGIQNPDKESGEQYLHILNLENLSLVSSGDYERYYTVDGKRYHHIIDPATLMPSEYFTAVSIVTEDSGLADAFTKAIYNSPFEEGLEMIEGMEGTEALWVMKDGTLRYSSGFEAMIKK
ncbi:thiamine biosynthesis lipoprotein [Anaerotaenia torta]|uniref:FAD:protein FMN transferase n=1 Tax=Anaerotaenia torta TaxID=433293 RepID=UPI003D23933E